MLIFEQVLFVLSYASGSVNIPLACSALSFAINFIATIAFFHRAMQVFHSYASVIVIAHMIRADNLCSPSSLR